MSTVYVRAQRGHTRAVRKFHKSKNCGQLTKRPARGTWHETVEADLRELRKVVPCRTCYPDAPVTKTVHRYCPKCNKGSARPCAHNGGVPVMVTGTTTYTSLLRDPGDTYVRLIHVWPERAHLHY